MKITPQRAELIMEAVQLREFGWAQQQIADCLNVPRQTIAYWLKHFGNGIYTSVGILSNNAKEDRYNLAKITAPPICLFPCLYEEATQHIESGSIDLILTDPPYLASATDMRRKNQASLQRDFGDWDNIPQEQYTASVSIWAGLMAEHLREGGSLYLFIGYRQSFLWGQALEQAGLSYNGLLVWHRTNPAPQIRKTRWCPAFDFILFYSKGSPHEFRWIGQNERTAPDVQNDLSNTKPCRYLVVCQAVEKFQPPDDIAFPLIIADPPWNISDPGHKRKKQASLF